MTNLIKIKYTGAGTVTCDVIYDNAGTLTYREEDLATTNEPAGSIIYKASPALIMAGDLVVVKIDGVEKESFEYNPEFALETTIASVTTADTVFRLTDGSVSDDAYKDMVFGIIDISNTSNPTMVSRRCTGYTGSTKEVTIENGTPFPLAGNDKIYVFSASSEGTISTAAAADIADAVWDEPLGDHIIRGTTGKRLNELNSLDR